MKPDYSEAPSTGVWVGLAAISMTFAAFTSAMVVRQGSASDWRHFAFPTILYFNTLTLIASSFTLQIARRRFAQINRAAADATAALRALYGTLVLGGVFVVGQYLAWQQLRAEGLYLSSAPSTSFFYIFTVLHALHVIGGLFGLVYVISKLHRSVLRRNTLDAASRYWHFMAVLWIYLLVLLLIRI
ncbi:MAG TPA: cytochrome c oxidase subunit 3 [Candidatus Angelobacter sp.]